MKGNRSTRNVVSITARTGTMLVLLAIVSLVTGAGVQAKAGTWVSGAVDSPKFFQSLADRSIRVDAARHPHIAYGGDHLYYAWRGETGWHLETADASSDVGTNLSLALDQNGYPHIAYSGIWNRTLLYAYKDASGWHRENLGVQADWDVSLAIDQAGYAYISYYDYADEAVKFAFEDLTGWHLETIVSGGERGSSLALDPSGHPHLAYAFNLYYLGHAYRDATGWHAETVPGTIPFNYVQRPSLDIDGEGYSHISYMGGERLD